MRPVFKTKLCSRTIKVRLKLGRLVTETVFIQIANGLAEVGLCQFLNRVVFHIRTGLAGRVTRLGEFILTGRLFSLAGVLKFTEVAQILGLLFSTVPVLYKF
jgi:hypothetical protein